MGDGKIDAGNKTRNHQPGLPAVESLAKADTPSAVRPRTCRAMLQQGADSGRANQSAPQKFVQLVGCRDPKARPEPGGTARPAPAKR